MDAKLNEDARQFEIDTAEGLAVLGFFRKDDKIALVHTEVPEALGGRGIGGDLVRTALDHARVNGLRVYPFCRFVRSYLTRHPDYEDLIEPLDEW